MAIKLQRRGSNYTAPTYNTNYSNGLLDNRYRGGNDQAQFISNMQRDPAMTLATSIGGLLGSVVGNTVNENGVRKGTESAMAMLDNMKQDGKVSPTVEQNGVVSMDNAGAKGLLSGVVDVTTPAPGVGFMQGYMSKYANEPNPVQAQADAVRATDFIKQSGGNLFANNSVEDIRNAIRRQAMAEGRSSQQIDRIMANVEPEITAGYNKYMDEKDAANYAAALGYIKAGRFNDAMGLVPNINNPNLVKALGTINDYAMQEKNYQLKRDALMMKATGRGSSVSASNGNIDDIVYTVPSKYSELYDKLPKPWNPLKPMKTDENGNTIATAQDVFNDKQNWEKSKVNLGDEATFNKEVDIAYQNIANAFNDKAPSTADGFNGVINSYQMQALLRNPRFAQALRNKLYQGGYLQNINEGWNEAYNRNKVIDDAIKQRDKDNSAAQAANQAEAEARNLAEQRAYNAYMWKHYPNTKNIYNPRPATDAEKYEAHEYARANWSQYR